jgi:long-subunit acyl-CoA synthetase (AMP-forming)
MVQSYLFRKFAVRDITTIQEAKASQIVRDFFKDKINDVNEYAQTNVHKIKKWMILDNEFTVVKGELTPTLKIKRKVIANIYEH